MKINDKVLANTDLIHCRLLGHIQDIVGDTYHIELLFPIRGVRVVQCQRYQIQKVEEKKPQRVENKTMKSASSRIIERLEAIADNTEQRQPEQPRTQRKTRDIQHSNNWLDYMEENNIE